MKLFKDIIHIFAPMIFGIVLARAFLFKDKKALVKQTITEVEYNQSKNNIGKRFEEVALKILLPSYVIEAIMKVPLSIELIGIFLLGILIPPSCYIICHIYNKLTFNKNLHITRFKDFRFLVSTFGGGNRGTIFVMVLFGASINFQEYLMYFSVIDLGNFAFLLIIMPILIRKAYGEPPEQEETLLKKLLDNYVVITFMWIAFYLILINLSCLEKYQIQNFFKDTAIFRKYLFTALLFGSIYLKTSFKKDVTKGFFPDLTAFFTIRASVIIVLSVVIYFFELSRAILLCSIILLLMPPSSILPSMISSATNHDKSITYVNTMTVSFNIIYIFLLAGGILFSFAQRL